MFRSVRTRLCLGLLGSVMRTAGAQLAHSLHPSLGKRLHIGVYLSQYQKTDSGILREVAL